MGIVRGGRRGGRSRRDGAVRVGQRGRRRAEEVRRRVESVAGRKQRLGLRGVHRILEVDLVVVVVMGV